MRVSLMFFLLAVSVGRADTDELIVFLLDTSGSMQGQEADMVKGINALIQSMAQTYESTGSKATFGVQMWTFSESSRHFLLEAPLQSIPSISLDQYVAVGGTPLFDVIGETLQSIKDGSTIVIATDGEDTTSWKFNKEKIHQLINDAKEKRDIQFVYIAKGDDAFTGGASVGLNTGHGSYSISVSASDSMGTVFAYPSMRESVSASAFRHLELKE